MVIVVVIDVCGMEKRCWVCRCYSSMMKIMRVRGMMIGRIGIFLKGLFIVFMLLCSVEFLVFLF